MALILCLIFVSGCGSDSHQDNANGLPIDTTTVADKLIPLNYTENKSTYENYGDHFVPGIQEILTDISTYTTAITDCDTDQDELEPNHPCKLTTFNIRDSLYFSVPRETLALDSSLGQRILLIDSELGQSAIRYPKRIIQVYEWAEDSSSIASIQLSTKTITMVNGLYHIYRNIIGDSNYFLPSSEITRQIAPETLSELLKVNVPLYDIHGDINLNLLMDLNPESQIVTLNSLQYSNQFLCGDAKESGTYRKSIVDSIKAVIREHKISYVHLSSGLDNTIIKNMIDNACGAGFSSLDKVAEIHLHYKNIISEISEVAVVTQASVISRIGTLPKPTNIDIYNEYYSDCSNIPNRLRSGHLSQSYPEGNQLPIIDIEGSTYNDHYDTLLQTSQVEITPCVDAFFNTGWRQQFLDLPSFGAYPILYGSDGISSGPLNFMSSSFINGVGLSYLNYIAITQQLSPREALNKLKNFRNSEYSPTLFDPMRFESLPHCLSFPEACRDWALFTVDL
ncbi:MAG: hypothetical protein V7785_00070 [Bermanella sp.]